MIKNVWKILGLLTAQFFLGMGLAVIGEPEPSMPAALKTIAYILFGLHIINALALAAFAVIIFRAGRRAGNLIRKRTAQGLASVILAFAGGLLTVSTPLQEFFSFVMATGFILAFISYGLLLIEQNPSAKGSG